MTTMLRLSDEWFPGDELIAQRDGDRIGIRCHERCDGDNVALVDLTFAQARELAAWLMANAPEVEA